VYAVCSVGAAQHDPQGLLLTLQLLESCALFQPQLLDLLLPVTTSTDAQGQQNKGVGHIFIPSASPLSNVSSLLVYSAGKHMTAAQHAMFLD
jgi:hypothetical protein